MPLDIHHISAPYDFVCRIQNGKEDGRSIEDKLKQLNSSNPTSAEQKNEIINFIENYYTLNNAFEKEMATYKRYINSDETTLRKAIKTANLSIADLHLDNVFISFTNSDSIFYRFNIAKTHDEFRLEYFLNYDKDNLDDCEAVLHIYSSGIKISSNYGSLEALVDLIHTTIKDHIANEPYKELTFSSWEYSNQT